MAIINGLYIHVTDEDVSGGVDSTDHPVESGIPLTDTVRAKAMRISLSGLIVDYGNKKASEVIEKIKKWRDSGSLIEFRGRNVASSMQIRSFETSHPNTVSGGAEFSMELQQVRIAKSAYVPQKASTTAKKEAAKKKPSPVELKVGAKVVFLGGYVYLASDSKKPMVTRGRSTCKITKINLKSWGIHPYHLVSTDGKRVYGWVDKEKIEGYEKTSTNGKTNAGTKQTKGGNSNTVVHKVKKGDIVYNLATKKYSELGLSANEIIRNNPKAFARPGDARTLIVGSELRMKRE